MTLDRRDLLRRTGAAAAVASTAGLAGCADLVSLGDDAETGDPPAYANWITTDEDDALFFTYVDWAAYEEHSDVEEDAGDEDDLEDGTEEDDPMLGFAEVSAMASASVVLGLANLTGLGGLFTFGEEESDLESDLEATLWINEAFVCLGDVDVEEIEAELTSTDDLGIAPEFDHVDEMQGYDVYERTDGEAAVAVDAEAIVFVGDDDDPVEGLREPLEAESGETDRAVDDDDLEWLLGAADGHVALGFYGEDGEEATPDEDEEEVDEAFESIQDATGAVGSITLESESEASGTFAALYDEIDGDLEADIESEVGDSAAESEVEIDDDRATGEATWEGNPLENGGI